MLWIKVKQEKETKEHWLVIAVLYGVAQISLIPKRRENEPGRCLRPKRNRE